MRRAKVPSGRSIKQPSRTRQSGKRFPLAVPLIIGLLFLYYALPLLWPPPAQFTEWNPQAHVLGRLFPGVPTWWIATRLSALLLCTCLFARFYLRPFEDAAEFHPTPSVAAWQERVALGLAVALFVAAPWVKHAGLPGQLAFLAGLFVPALCLWSPSPRPQQSAPTAVALLRPQLPVVLVTVAWVGFFVGVELGSLEATRAVDQWRAFVDALQFAARNGKLFGERYDAELPNLGALPFLFQGVPLWQLGLVEPSLASMQLAQMSWLAVAAAGLALLATRIGGALPALIGTTGFLFSPFTHYLAVLPAPFVFAPVVTVALLLAVWRFRLNGSRASLVCTGPLAAFGLTFPSVVPIVGVAGLAVLARWPSTWRTHRLTWVAGALIFSAALLPAIPEVFSLREGTHHFSFHGIAASLDRALLGQGSVLLMERSRSVDIRRPLDIVLGALLAPFAHPRLHIRLWTDAIFDPFTATLFALGLLACVHNFKRSATARELLILFLAALSPAFVSPVDLVDMVHAVSLGVPVALIAALGAGQILAHIPDATRPLVAALTSLGCCTAGALLSHEIPQRWLCASSTGIAFESLAPRDAPRAVVIDYPAGFHHDVRWLYVGPMTAYGWALPVGYLRLEQPHLPVDQLVADGKDLVFWSPGLEEDFNVRKSLCRFYPGVVLFQVWDRAGLGHVWAARLSEAPWEPRVHARRWRLVACG
ncbi:MAG: hypothetical protein N3C12_07650 [Candidatus Binatia bacterium]|nr:hypothetical protein [Candidatus Binatia bacterium]